MRRAVALLAAAGRRRHTLSVCNFPRAATTGASTRRAAVGREAGGESPPVPFAPPNPALRHTHARRASSDHHRSSAGVDAEEVAKFDADAGAWWDAAGPAAPLHALNPVRADFVKRVVCDAHGLDHTALEPLTGLSIVDVGCGGGLLSEALARLGAAVTGVDASAGGVAAAWAHAAGDPRIAARVSYSVSTAEELVAAGRSFDAVVASEVIEHVPAPGPFVHALASLLAPASRGPVVVSTLSRTPRAYATAILGAEVLARVVPHGTHDWHRFLTPEDLALLGDDAGLALDIACGMTPVPTRAGLRWRLTGDLGVNYIVSLVRTGGGE